MSFKKYILIIGIWAIALSAMAQNPEMAFIKKGKYTPLYGRESSKINIGSFLMDTIPVTKAAYLEFLKKNPEWQKANVKGLFADMHYLTDWNTDFQLNDKDAVNEPITNVSWFAAKTYCKCQGKRLPTLDEWEYVGMADEKNPDARKIESYNQYILEWYERPKSTNQKVGSTFKNYWGIYDMHGLVWEWTQDFNSLLISSESRNGGKNNNLFCSAAAVGATDLMNYAAFMRYAFRSSLKGNYSVNNLGFRCAKDLEN